MYPRSRITSRQSKRFAEKRRNRSLLFYLLIVVCVFSWGFSVSRFTRLSILTIYTVNVQGADEDIINPLQAAAINSIDGDYLGLFSKSNTLIYPKREIIKKIKEASLKVESIDVHRAGANTLTVIVKEKNPEAIICAALPDFDGNNLSIADSENCYFADANGFIFSEAPLFSGHIYNRYYVPNLPNATTSLDGIVGSYIASTSKFSSLQRLYGEMKKEGLNPAAILMNEGGEYELYAQNSIATAIAPTSLSELNDIMVIYFNDKHSFDEQLANLFSFWNHMMVNKAGKDLPEFEYIDVRYGTNVFYRTIK